jgi:hypothetical protein
MHHIDGDGAVSFEKIHIQGRVWHPAWGEGEDFAIDHTPVECRR